VLLLSILVSCTNAGQETAATVVPPTPTAPVLATSETSAADRDRRFIVIATDAPNPPFTQFDQFGNVTGFNNALMDNIAATADFDYEFVVTPHEGVLESIATNSTQDFDAVMSALIAPATPMPGIAYTEPYLEIGQVLVVLADEKEIVSYRDIQPGMKIGVQGNSSGEETARGIVGLDDTTLSIYENDTQALQALIDEAVDAVIIDSYSAEYYSQTFPEQLKIAGGEGRAAWISSKAYVMAVSARDASLLERLNRAITQVKNNRVIERLTVAWLITPGEEEAIDPGESRVGTPANELIIGVVGMLADMDPARPPDLLSWEIKNNTMSGLFMFNSSNELVPILAADFPAISEDKLEYTIRLRRDMRFPDGSEFTADDVQWSINRSRALGNFLINDILKDSNDDNFADEDAVQVIDPFTVKFVLQEATAYFPNLLATPPYFPISRECYGEALALTSSCGGIGPYTIVNWEANERIRLKANPEWPGRPAPAFENIQVRFYEDATSLRRALEELKSIDMAWTGLPFDTFAELGSKDLDGDGNVDFRTWEGPSFFKSYLIFEQNTPPWDSKKVRQAVAYAIDRAALASGVFGGGRQPLLSPVPNSIPGHTPVLPERNLGRARSLLLEEGYNQTNPLPITIWYLNDGRYSAVEEAYANALKAQLEETEVFQVTLSSATWEVYQTQIYSCAYPAYLMGWPSPGKPTDYLDITSWIDFFVQNSSQNFCSNYESEAMNELVAAAKAELEPAARMALYAQIQQLWADELPTLDLTQEPRRAVSLTTVDNVRIDALGLLHYEVLTKGGG
jgi:peptide/nickel transport system substrate-binding protein